MSNAALYALGQIKGLPLDLQGVMFQLANAAHEYNDFLDGKKRGVKPSQAKERPRYIDDEYGNEKYNLAPADISPVKVYNAWLADKVNNASGDGSTPAVTITEESIGRDLAVLRGKPSRRVTNSMLPKDIREKHPEAAYMTLAEPFLIDAGWTEDGARLFRLNLVEITAEERAAYKKAHPNSEGTLALRFPAVSWKPCPGTDPADSNEIKAAAKKERDAKKAAAAEALQAANEKQTAEIARLQAELAALRTPTRTEAGGVPAQEQVPPPHTSGLASDTGAGLEALDELRINNEMKGTSETAARPSDVSLIIEEEIEEPLLVGAGFTKSSIWDDEPPF